MKFSLSLLAFSLMVGVAAAQDPQAPAANQASPAAAPTQSSDTSSSADRAQSSDKSSTADKTESSGKTSAADRAQGSDKQSGAAKTQSSDTTSSTAASTQSGNALPELKTQSYKGTLVDASCAGGGSSSAASASTTPASTTSTKPAASGGASADRSGGSCSVSTSTSQFALQTKDGRTLRFDSVGNERAKEALQTKKKWSEAVSSGKPIEAKVSAAETGDKLTVLSIH